MASNIEHVYVEPVPTALRNIRLLVGAGITFTGKRVLDVGCGTGVYTRILSSLGAISVLGIDASAENITLASAESCPLNLEFRRASVETFEALEQFDLIFARGVLYYCLDIERVLEKLRGILAPGGELFLTLTDRTIRSEVINYVKKIATRLPVCVKPTVRSVFSLVYFLLLSKDRYSEEELGIVKGKMNTIFFPALHLIRPDEAERYLGHAGFAVRRVFRNRESHGKLSFEYGIWAVAHDFRESVPSPEVCVG